MFMQEFELNLKKCMFMEELFNYDFSITIIYITILKVF